MPTDAPARVSLPPIAVQSESSDASPLDTPSASAATTDVTAKAIGKLTMESGFVEVFKAAGALKMGNLFESEGQPTLPLIVNTLRAAKGMQPLLLPYAPTPGQIRLDAHPLPRPPLPLTLSSAA